VRGPALLRVVISQRLCHRLSEAAFERAFYGSLLLLGGCIVVRGWWGSRCCINTVNAISATSTPSTISTPNRHPRAWPEDPSQLSAHRNEAL